MSNAGFYDQLAEHYHQTYQDWQAAIVAGATHGVRAACRARRSHGVDGKRALAHSTASARPPTCAASTRRIEYGQRETPLGKVTIFQTRQWSGDRYALQFHFVEEDGKEHIVGGGHYRAYSARSLLDAMRVAGYEKVRRVDAPFFQPALIGHRT